MVASACSSPCLCSTSTLPGPTCVRKRCAHCQGRHASPRNVFAGITLCGQIAAHDGILVIQLCQLHCPSCATTSSYHGLPRRLRPRLHSTIRATFSSAYSPNLICLDTGSLRNLQLTEGLNALAKLSSYRRACWQVPTLYACPPNY